MEPHQRVVDTSAWIEWLTASAVGQTLAAEFPDKAHCVVPTIVQLELSKWLLREVGEERADQVIAYTLKCTVAPLDTAVALLAADLHRAHKLATADAIVYATARHLGAQLLTCDAHFDGLPGVVFLPKPDRQASAQQQTPLNAASGSAVTAPVATLGVRPLPSRGGIVSPELIDRLHDDEAP